MFQYYYFLPTPKCPWKWKSSWVYWPQILITTAVKYYESHRATETGYINIPLEIMKFYQAIKISMISLTKT